MPLYKYVTIDILKKILQGAIRFTQPNAFNDPFELLPELYVPKSFSGPNVNISFSLTAPRRTDIVIELEPSFTSELCNDVTSRRIRNELSSSIGILCLSKNPGSLLMWAHYADQYTGAVIEFDETHVFFEGKIEVEYSNSRPKKDISIYQSQGEAVPIAELCTKSSEWKYEEEVRIIRCLSDCQEKGQDPREFTVYTLNMPIECIKTITLGERSTEIHQKEIWDLVKDTNIALDLATISYWGYEFNPELIKLNMPMSPVFSPRAAHIFSHYAGDIGEAARWAGKKHRLSEISKLKA